MSKLFIVLGIGASGLFLTACAENFSWQDSSTWRFRMTDEERTLYELEQACLDYAGESNRRVFFLDGTTGPALQTECQPFTNGPLKPQRFEGR